MLRSFAERKEGLTRFVKPESPCYIADDDNVRLFPFSYSDGKLDITYDGNDFEARMVVTTGMAPQDVERDYGEIDTACSILSGPYLVRSLGDNFKAYIRAWRDATIDPDSPIEIYINPQVFKVQEVDINSISSNSGETYNITTSAPVSDTYVSGTVANKYYTTYVFKTPLTFTIMEDGVKKYITFRTAMDQE
jgi:hypothetical protein